MILIRLREHGGDETLAKGVIERVVDSLHADAESGGGIPVNDQRSLQSAVLLVGGDVAKRAEGIEFFNEARGSESEFFGVGIFKRVLELGAADAIFDAEILDGLQIEADAFYASQFFLEAADDVTRAGSGRAALG